MSSYNCPKCHERIWDKDIGYIGGTYEEEQILDQNVVVVCGFCGDETITARTPKINKARRDD